MTGAALQPRCWNHEAREAVCRCPQCGRCFCRECVTEHEARLLCAACLRTAARAGRSRGGALRRMAPAGMLLGGVALAWVLFYAAGETFLEMTAHAEQSSWQGR